MAHSYLLDIDAYRIFLAKTELPTELIDLVLGYKKDLEISEKIERSYRNGCGYCTKTFDNCRVVYMGCNVECNPFTFTLLPSWRCSKCKRRDFGCKRINKTEIDLGKIQQFFSKIGKFGTESFMQFSKFSPAAL